MLFLPHLKQQRQVIHVAMNFWYTENLFINGSPYNVAQIRNKNKVLITFIIQNYFNKYVLYVNAYFLCFNKCLTSILYIIYRAGTILASTLRLVPIYQYMRRVYF